MSVASLHLHIRMTFCIQIVSIRQTFVDLRRPRVSQLLRSSVDALHLVVATRQPRTNLWGRVSAWQNDDEEETADLFAEDLPFLAKPCILVGMVPGDDL